MANKKAKWTYELVKEYVESLGYELISEKYINIDERLCFKDLEGYYYMMSFYNLCFQKNNPQKFQPSNLYTIQNIKLFIELNNLNFKLLNTVYKNNSNKLVLQDNEGYFYEISLNNFITCKNSKKFHKFNSYTIQNIKLWCKLHNKPFKLLNNQKYNGSDKKLKWQCLKDDCGEIFESNWGSIISGSGCGFCHGLQVGISNCLATKNPELAKEWHPTLNGELTPHNVTVNSGIYAWWQCKINENHIWYAEIRNRNRTSGCPICNQSKGEKQLDYILTQYNIPHGSQYKFDDLIGIGKGLLRFDISVFYDEEETQLRMLIEYDGEQHFKWVEGMMSKEEFETLQIHDGLKNKYCFENNISLLRIPYWDFDNIESILQKELNLNNLNDIKLAI